MEESKLFLGLEIEINHGCNRACSYCPNADYERSEQGEMDTDLFIKIMTQLREMNYKGGVRYHFYNEPMLCKKLNQFVALTKEFLPESFREIFTNGTLLTPKRFEELIELGVDKFTITKHENEKNYTFDKTMEQLTFEQKEKVKYINYEELRYTNRGGLVESRYKAKPPLKLPCLIPSMSLVITVKGNVLTCYEDYNQRSQMGNVNDTHLRDIWNSPAYRQFRDDLKKGKREGYTVCKSCNNVQIIQ